MDTHYQRVAHDPFGWLKTLGLVVAVFSLMIGSSILVARADPCADSCRAKHNQCRLDTKGSSQCDAAVNACVQACVASMTKTKK